MFYVDGDYEARKGSGIGKGSISLHPGGHAHGPQPGRLRALDRRGVLRRARRHGRHLPAARARRGRARRRRRPLRLVLGRRPRRARSLSRHPGDTHALTFWPPVPDRRRLVCRRLPGGSPAAQPRGTSVGRRGRHACGDIRGRDAGDAAGDEPGATASRRQLLAMAAVGGVGAAAVAGAAPGECARAASSTAAARGTTLPADRARHDRHPRQRAQLGLLQGRGVHRRRGQRRRPGQDLDPRHGDARRSGARPAASRSTPATPSRARR